MFVKFKNIKSCFWCSIVVIIKLVMTMNNLNKEIGARILNLREHLNLTREGLSEIAGVSDRFIYDVEVGKKGMSAESLYKFSKALNVSSDYLLFGENNASNVSYLNEMIKSIDKEDLPEIEKIFFLISKILKRTK